MRKAIVIIISSFLSFLSLWADSSPKKSKDNLTEIRLPEHRFTNRTETFELYMADS